MEPKKEKAAPGRTAGKGQDKDIKLTPPLIYLELIKFIHPRDEGFLFCALWQKAITWNNNFTFTIQQAQQECDMKKGEYIKIMKKFEKQGIILPIRAKNNTRKFQINFRALAMKDAIHAIIKPSAVKQYQQIFSNLALKYPIELLKNLTFYRLELNNNPETAPYYFDYEALETLIIRDDLMFRACSLEPISFEDFQQLSGFFYNSFKGSKPDILEYVEKTLTNKYLVKQYSNMKKLLFDRLKVEIDQELKTREKQATKEITVNG